MSRWRPLRRARCGRARFGGQSPVFENLTWRSIGPAVCRRARSGGCRYAARPIACTTSAPPAAAYGRAPTAARRGSRSSTSSRRRRSARSQSIRTTQNVVWVGTGESNPRNDVTYGDGLYKSTDGGKTWTQRRTCAARGTSRGSPSIRRIRSTSSSARSATSSPTRRIAASTLRSTAARRGARRSTSGRAAARAISAMDRRSNPERRLRGHLGVSPRNRGRSPAAAPTTGSTSRATAARRWKRLTGHGLPAGITGRIGLAIAPSNGKRVYALIEAKGGILWRSDDAGATWTADVERHARRSAAVLLLAHRGRPAQSESRVRRLRSRSPKAKTAARNSKRSPRTFTSTITRSGSRRTIRPHHRRRGRRLRAHAPTAARTGRSRATSRSVSSTTSAASTRTRTTSARGLQDNNAFLRTVELARPARASPTAIGSTSSAATAMWAVPDPIDPNYIWTDSAGRPSRCSTASARVSRFVLPYYDFAKNDFDVAAGASIASTGIRRSRSRRGTGTSRGTAATSFFKRATTASTGRRSAPISRSIVKEHQHPCGRAARLRRFGRGIFRHDSRRSRDRRWSRARFGSAPTTGSCSSRATAARIGKTSRRPASRQYGRVETVAPSPLVAGTAYANRRSPPLRRLRTVSLRHARLRQNVDEDRRRSAGRPVRAHGAPRLGQSQSRVRGDRARHLRVVRRRRALAKPPVEFTAGFGARHSDPAAVRRPALATHGRALWIIDDSIRALQDLPQAPKRPALGSLHRGRRTSIISIPTTRVCTRAFRGRESAARRYRRFLSEPRARRKRQSSKFSTRTATSSGA